MMRLLMTDSAGAFCTPARQHAAKGPACAHTHGSPSQNERNDATALHSLPMGGGVCSLYHRYEWCSQVTRTILNTCLCLFLVLAALSVTHFLVTFRDTFPVLGFSISLFKRLVLLLFFLGIECTQQASKALFILLWVGPVLEVADVPGALDIVHPRLCAGQDSLVYSNRIQHIWYTLRLLVQDLFHFVRNPLACSRELRQDQQQLIIQPDRFFNTVPDLVSDVHILWRKPATDTFLLQVIMQASCKQLILTRIADKACVVFNWFGGQRTNIVNEGVIQSCSTKKEAWNVSLRTREGASADVGWPIMPYGLKVFDGAKVYTSECSPSYGGSAEVGVAEVGVAEIGVAEVGVAEVGVAEIGVAEVGVVKAGSAEVGSAEVGSAEVGVAEVGVAEVGSAEVGSAEVGVAEVGSAEVGSAEVGVADVNRCARSLCSPDIPCFAALLEDVHLFLSCHASFTLSYCSNYKVTCRGLQEQIELPTVCLFSC